MHKGKVVVLYRGLQLCTECVGLGVSLLVQFKVSPHLCFAWGTLPEL